MVDVILEMENSICIDEFESIVKDWFQMEHKTSLA